jgi:tetratricopeptide (TPR) repeat protein
MYNLLIALGAAVAAFLLFWAPGLVNWWGALLPATIALAIVYFVLARRTLRGLEAIMMTAQRDLGAKRVEPALAKIREGFELAKWQFFVAPQVHAQLGMILYMLQRDAEAKEHLSKSLVRIAQARAMYGAILFKEKNYPKMEQVFEEALRYSKKDGFVWSIYAWCLDAAGMTDKAIGALSRGVAESPGDEKLKQNQLALQNEKRLKMKAYGNEWWAYQLERPPASVLQGMAPSGVLQPRKGYRTPPQRRN